MFCCRPCFCPPLGGVLEHPANSLAWGAFGLLRPIQGGWSRSLFGDIWTTEVYQRNYGHPAKKRTWLAYCGNEPPPLDWSPPEPPEAWISSDRPRSQLRKMGIRQLNSREAKATPIPFRDLLISIAESAT